MNNYILKNENAIYYECGFSCDNVIFLTLGKESFFITDARYTLEAKEKIKTNCKVIETSDLIKESRRLIKKNKIKKLSFDPNDFSYASFIALSKKIDIKFISKPNFSQLKRIIKSDDEIKLLSKAAILGREGFNNFAKFISNNKKIKSEKELYFKAFESLTQMGELTTSFDPIVAINENSAKPHALPTSKKLINNDLLLVDAGVKYNGYCSDRTATACFRNGKISFNREQNFKYKKHQKIYDIVYKAQQTAINNAKSGMKASQIDKLARDVIIKAGYEKYFIHSTGHGVGLDIHEYPNISARSDFIIEDNMVFTVEPGIYLPNEFGVRIEDTVVMKNGKAIIL